MYTYRVNMPLSLKHSVAQSIQHLYVESDGEMYQAVTRLKNSTDTIMKIR